MRIALKKYNIEVKLSDYITHINRSNNLNLCEVVA